jgi:hypothetical protein
MLTNIFKLTVATLVVFASSTISDAQGLSGALSEANVRVVCGADTLVSAKYLADGSLEVTCKQNTSTATTQTELQGTELTTANTPLGLTTALIGLTALVGNSNTATTSTHD